METITRVGFCQKCADAKRPQNGQYFLVYGSTHHQFKVLQAEVTWKHQYGYVPHVYKLVTINHPTGIATINKSCAMHECGVAVKPEAGGSNFFYVKEWTVEKWKLESWEALKKLKHNFFTKDYEI